MSEKVLDSKGRWRNKIVAFRMSEEEAIHLNKLVEISGLTKQEYLINRTLQEDIVVNGNPRVFRRLKNNMDQIIEELEKIECGCELSLEQLEWILKIERLYVELYSIDYPKE